MSAAAVKCYRCRGTGRVGARMGRTGCRCYDCRGKGGHPAATEPAVVRMPAVVFTDADLGMEVQGDE